MSENIIPKKIRSRQYEITEQFLDELEIHLNDLLAGRATEMFEIRDFADKLHIHPRHLTNTVKLTTGKSPCDFFEEKIMNIAKKMLVESESSISEIAFDLTFDPSNFTKFFKRFAGITPKQYRENFRLEKYSEKTEVVTK
jgi:AraC-like DNA-binding protein